MSNTVPTSNSTQERITASRITDGVVIAVEKRGEKLFTTRRKRDVIHATVTGKDMVPLEGMRERGYLIHTTAGDIEPVRGITSFPLISAPQVPAGAPDAAGVVVGGTVVAMVERFDLVDDVPAPAVDPSALWHAYEAERTTAEQLDAPAPARDDMRPRTEVFRGRKLRTVKGPQWGQITQSVNGEVVCVVSGSSPEQMNEKARQLRRDVIAADERRITDADAYPEHWYKGAPAPGPATVAWQQHAAKVERELRAELNAATCPDRYGHRPGTPGCPVTVPDCNGIPTELAGNITERPVTHPAQTGADEIGAEIAGHLRHRFTVGDVTTGYTDPSRNRGIREVSTWSVTVDGHTVTALRYTGRDTDLSTLKDYVCVLVDGASVGTTRTVEPADIARVARDFITDLAAPAVTPSLAGPMATFAAGWSAVFGDDARAETAPAVDQVDAPAVAEVAPAPGPDTSITQRGAVRVTLVDGAGTVIRDWTRPTWNSGISDSEREVRKIAREEGAPYHGATPERTGEPGTVTDTYRRVWTSSYGILTATVTRPVPAITAEPAATAPAVDAYAARVEHYRARGEDYGTAFAFASLDMEAAVPAGDQVDAPAATVTIEERPSGTPVLAPSPGTPVRPSSAVEVLPALPVRDDIAPGLPYVTDLPADWTGDVVTLTPTDLGKLLRRKGGFLAAWFPGVKFSVRGDYSSIDIRWTGGPAADLVDLPANMWEGKTRDSQAECDHYRGAVLYVAGDGTATAYNLPGVYVFTHRTAGPDDAARGRRFLPAGGPKHGAEYVWDEVADPYGRPVIGGSPDEVARQLASRGADEWTRTGHDTRPVCPVERCSLASGHPFPGMHRDDYGRAFLATLPAGGDEGDQGGDGGQPTDVDPIGPAPAGDQVDERPTFRTWEELAAWIGGADVPALLDPARYAVTRPVDVPTWSAPAVPAVAVSFTCPAHGVVPVPVNIDSEQAGRIRQEHQECTAGDPFGLHASEKRDTGAARLAASLVASGWTAEEAENATAPHPGRMFTVTNDALGNIRVHRAGCRDIGRHSSGGGTHWDVRAEDVRGVVLDMWPDEATADNWREYNDLQVMDCAGDLPEVADQVDAPAVAEPAPVKVADLVDGDRVHVYGVDQFGSPTHGAGYVNGTPGAVTVNGRTKAGRVSKDPKKSRPGLLVSLSENPNGWNGWRMTVITTPDAMAEHVTDADAHQYRPVSVADSPRLIRARCSCGEYLSTGHVPHEVGRVFWQRHADCTPPADVRNLYTVTNNARGTLRVHAVGCRDIGRDSAGGGTHWDVRADDMADIVCDLYDDATRETWQEFAGDITVMPCAGEIPDDVQRAAKLAELVADGGPGGVDQVPGRVALALIDRAEQAGAARFAAGEDGAMMGSAAFREILVSAGAAGEWGSYDLKTRLRDAFVRGYQTAAGGVAEQTSAVAEEPAGDQVEYHAEDLGDAAALIEEGPEDAPYHVVHTKAGGTEVHGSSRGDGVWEILNSYGQPRTFGGQLYLRGTRNKLAVPSRIRSIGEDIRRKTGCAVRIVVDNRAADVLAREEDRRERVEARVEKLEERAVRRTVEARQHAERAEKLTEGIPMGQPVLMDHYSAPRHLRTLDRSDNARRKGWEASDRAEYAEQRAAGAQANEEAKSNPRAMIRRRERLQEDERYIVRSHDGAEPDPRTIAGQRLAELRAEIALITERLGKLAEAGDFVAWTRDDFRAGDEVNVGGTWHRVIKANAKSITVPWWGSRTPDTDTKGDRAPYDRVHGRRRDGWQLDKPNGEPWPVTDAKRVDQWLRLSIEAGRPHSEESARKRRVWVQIAERIAYGLDMKTATDSQVEAYRLKDERLRTVAGRRGWALHLLGIFERLDAGEKPAEVAASVQAADVEPAWTMPAGTPVDVRVDQLRRGDIIAGFWNTGGLGPRDLSRHFSGPVAWVSKVDNRRERGDWVTVRLANGAEKEFKSHIWFATYPQGRPTVKVAELVAGQRADIRGRDQFAKPSRAWGYVSAPTEFREGTRNRAGELTGHPMLGVTVSETPSGLGGTVMQMFTERDAWCALLPDTEPETPDALTLAWEAGAGAYDAGRPRAAAIDATVRELIKGLPVGDGAAEIMESFTYGYDEAANAATALVLAGDAK